MFTGLGICGPFMLLIRTVGMLVYGKYATASILKEQAILSMTFIAIFANTCATTQATA